MGGEEIEFVRKAFDSNYIAPLGPQVDAFEGEFCEKIGADFYSPDPQGAVEYLGKLV